MGTTCFARQFGNCWEPLRFSHLFLPQLSNCVLALYVLNLPMFMAWFPLPQTRIRRGFGESLNQRIIILQDSITKRYYPCWPDKALKPSRVEPCLELSRLEAAMNGIKSKWIDKAIDKKKSVSLTNSFLLSYLLQLFYRLGRRTSWRHSYFDVGLCH
jgi:hypothetical protein